MHELLSLTLGYPPLLFSPKHWQSVLKTKPLTLMTANDDHDTEGDSERVCVVYWYSIR